MSERCKSTLHSAMQVKNWRKVIRIEEQSEVMSWLQEGEWIVDIYHNVRLAHSSVCMIRDNAGRIKESAKSGTKLCSKTTTVLSEWTAPKSMDVSLLHFIALK